MRRSWFLAPLLAAAGCDIPFVGPDCIDESRSLSVSTALMAPTADATPSDTGTATFSLTESRNHRSKRTSRRDMTWSVRSGLTRGTVTAVHVHAVGGVLLFDVPIDSTSGPPSVITQVFQGQPYSGPVGWDELYQALGEGRAYVDVHTTARPVGQLAGLLQPVFPNWQSFTHAYCS